MDLNGTLLHKSARILAYADDTNILARSQESAKEAFVKFGEVAKKVGLKISEEKIKFITQTRRKTPIIQNMTLSGCNFDQVHSFMYFGITRFSGQITKSLWTSEEFLDAY